MEWQEYLTPAERERLKQIERERGELTAEYRRIYDRCRKRSQKTLGGVEMTTGRGDVFLVDPSDAPTVALHRWQSVSHDGKRERPYVAATVDGKRVMLHRFLTGAPQGVHVDHIDGDTLNNCRANLRLCTPAENTRFGVQRRAQIGIT